MNNFNGLAMTSGTSNTCKDPIEKLIIGIFLDDSVNLAAIYCEHSLRTEISTRDIHLAIMTRAYYGKTFWTHEGISARIEAVADMLETNKDFNDILESEDKDSTNSPNIAETLSTCICICELCTTFNGITGLWDLWEPENEVDQIFKTAINSIIKK